MVISGGIKQLVNVVTVGSNGLFIGTPATASAAQGTALGRLERRIRRNLEWEADRVRHKAEGGGKSGRKRGKGAQLRRRLVRQQKARLQVACGGGGAS